MHDQKKLWNEKHFQGKIQHYSNKPTPFALSVLPLLKPTSNILELGCGVGNDAIAFAQDGHNVVATDFSEVAIEKNRERFEEVTNLTFEILDMSKPFQLQDNSFDLVYARLSLHYFTDDVTKRIFDDIYKVLKPQGLLCFMCKSTNDARYGVGRKIEEDMFENQGHVRHFFSEAYAKTCLKNKLTIIKIGERPDVLYDDNSVFVEVIAQKI